MNFTKTPRTPGNKPRSFNGKNPMTPSSAADMLGSLSLSSPTKSVRGGAGVGDITNPFITSGSKSRSNSPLKKSTSSGYISNDMKRQASMGVLRKGGVESKMDVITLDRNLPRPESIKKRSKSQPPVRREKTFKNEPGVISGLQADRFISTRDEQENIPIQPIPTSNSSPGHIMRLAEATGVPLNKRVLAFHEAPPAPSADTLMKSQRSIAAPLFAKPRHLGTSNNTSKQRKIRTAPERVLDAPDIVDDYYLNLVDWSCHNVVAVGLASSTYIWNADKGEVKHITDAPEGSYVASVEFSKDGAFLAVAFGDGLIELWDVEAHRRLRRMLGRQAQVAVMSWNQHVLSSGCMDGSIWHHDVRIAQHKVMDLRGHNGEVCGLEWRSDGEFLASGGNDNVVNIWDGRVGDVTPESRGGPRWTKRNHTAAVKALAWCPWQPQLLASGGGTGDCTVNIWNTTTGARISSVKTPAQVTTLNFCPHKKEFVSTHGGPTNSIMVHSYPTMDTVAEIREAHDARVLFSSLAPGGEMLVTAAADENLKFWKIWEAPPKKKVEKNKGMTAAESVLGMR